MSYGIKLFYSLKRDCLSSVVNMFVFCHFGVSQEFHAQWNNFIQPVSEFKNSFNKFIFKTKSTLKFFYLPCVVLFLCYKTTHLTNCRLEKERFTIAHFKMKINPQKFLRKKIFTKIILKINFPIKKYSLKFCQKNSRK